MATGLAVKLTTPEPDIEPVTTKLLTLIGEAVNGAVPAPLISAVCTEEATETGTPIII